MNGVLFHYASPSTNADVEVCSTSIVGVSSSGFLFDGILLLPFFPSLVIALKKIAKTKTCTVHSWAVYNGENSSKNNIIPN